MNRGLLLTHVFLDRENRPTDGHRLTQIRTKTLTNIGVIGGITASKIFPAHHAQPLNYLHAANLKIGLLVNFGYYPKLEYKRIVL